MHMLRCTTASSVVALVTVPLQERRLQSVNELAPLHNVHASSLLLSPSIQKRVQSDVEYILIYFKH
jgi:hypothetical protein